MRKCWVVSVTSCLCVLDFDEFSCIVLLGEECDLKLVELSFVFLF